MRAIQELELEGCWELQQFRYSDERGVFVKPWHTQSLKQLGLCFEVREVFWSVSQIGNIRGMHFQVPPHEHHKLVSCQKGFVCDVLLDLRINSSTYGKVISLELSDEQANAVYIPAGVAHGFQCLTESSQVLYLTSREHHPESDHGVRWNSFGFKWPLLATQISVRDQRHPALSDFKSPI